MPSVPMNSVKREASNINVFRAGLGAALFISVQLPWLFQPALNKLWEVLKVNFLFRASFFETIWTILWYIVIELFYTSIVINPQSQNLRLDPRPGIEHLYRNGTVKIVPWAKRLPELFTYVGPLLFLDLTMIKKYAGVSIDQLLTSGGYSTASLGPSLHFFTGIAIRSTYLVPSLHNFSWSSPLQIERALPAFPPTSRAIAFDLIASLVLYDFLFFVPHVLLHRVPILYRNFHETHHHHSEIQPQVTNRLDVTERLMLLLAANFALNLLGAHPITRVCFVPLFLALLIENHVGQDLPYSYDKILPLGMGAGPSVHALHHKHGMRHYQPYFTWADNLLWKIEHNSTRGIRKPKGSQATISSLRLRNAIQQ
ncbi:MAG: hypothetical protein CYPHOPRED_004208 [Cyphobasidiales sp. Tagirdzhanova-0007]|nr:MAG: hypothetical protein CYPHOPRED_004208 [Cyphobasidiales sp. Tagirdzhanova-0007]